MRIHFLLIWLGLTLATASLGCATVQGDAGITGDINESMVHEGWSVLYTVPPNVKYATRLGQAQKEARVNGAGLWAEHGFECLPRDFRRRRCVS